MERAAKRQYLPLTDSDVIQIVAMLDAGQKGKDIAIQMGCSQAQVSAIGTGRAFKRLAVKSAKHRGRPPRAPLPLAKRKPILWKICRAEFLYGPVGISQTKAQELVTGKPGQSHPAIRRVTLQAIRSCENLIARVRSSVGPPDFNGCRRWTGPVNKQHNPPTPISYLASDAVDPLRILLALQGRSIKKFERLRFTCPDGNPDGRCVESSHCVSKRRVPR